MTARNFYVPGNHALNTNGIAIPGATASLYTTGTTTPVAFYSDSALSVSLGSTITANGAGRFPTAYGADTTAYRLILKDADGAELDGGDIDPFYFGSIYVNDSSNPVSVLDYIPPQYHAAIAARASTVDVASYIQDAVDAIDALGGGTLRFEAGTHKVGSYISLPDSVTISGKGPRSSIITCAHAGGGGANASEDLRNGSVFVSSFTSNGSNTAQIKIRDIGITSTNALNVGAAYYDNCGTFIHVENVRVSGFKYGVVLDQSELADIDLCNFDLQTAAGVWLVNGNSLKAGNSQQFTNRISVKRSQFNAGVGVYGILDDGGTVHAYEDNNYNGCLNSIRVAGVEGLSIIGGEWEGSTGSTLVIEYRRSDDLSGVGACTGVSIHGGLMVPLAGQKAIDVVSGSVSLGGGWQCSTSVGAISVANANVSFGSASELMQVGAGALMDADWAAGFTRDGISYLAAAPAARYHRKGELVLNNNPGSASVLGWHCTVSGTPGTWVAINTLLADGNNTLTSTATYNAATGANPSLTVTQGGVSVVCGGVGSVGYVQSIGGALYINAGGNNVQLATNAHVFTATAQTSAASIKSTHATGGIGYDTGAGGAVTQITSRTTGVTLNKACGAITLFSAAGSTTAASFTVTNSAVAATDTVVICQKSGADKYNVRVSAVGAGSFEVTFATISGTTTEQPVFNFAVIKAVAA